MQLVLVGLVRAELDLAEVELLQSQFLHVRIDSPRWHRRLVHNIFQQLLHLNTAALFRIRLDDNARPCTN